MWIGVKCDQVIWAGMRAKKDGACPELCGSVEARVASCFNKGSADVIDRLAMPWSMQLYNALLLASRIGCDACSVRDWVIRSDQCWTADLPGRYHTWCLNRH